MYQVVEMRTHATNFNAANIRRTGLLLISSCLFLFTWALIQPTGAIQIAQRRLSPSFTLTYVHGDKDAMKTHIEALQFCRGLGRPRADAEVAYETPGVAGNASPTQDTTKATTSPESQPTTATDKTSASTIENGVTAAVASTINPPPQLPVGHIVQESDGTRFRSDLVSVHDGHMVNELMRWILGMDRRQFWIGGVAKMIEHNFQPDQETLRHLLQLWTDKTPPNFRFLHYDNPMLASMQPGDLACVSVDYASGKWGLHNCDTTMYFVCETVELGKEKRDADHPVPNAASVSTTDAPPAPPIPAAVTMTPIATTAETHASSVLPASITLPPNVINTEVAKTALSAPSLTPTAATPIAPVAKTTEEDNEK